MQSLASLYEHSLLIHLDFSIFFDYFFLTFRKIYLVFKFLYDTNYEQCTHFNFTLSMTCLVAKLCDPSPPGSSVHGISQAKYWRGLPLPTPGELPKPRIKPASPSQADSLPLSHQMNYHFIINIHIILDI